MFTDQRWDNATPLRAVCKSFLTYRVRKRQIFRFDFLREHFRKNMRGECIPFSSCVNLFRLLMSILLVNIMKNLPKSLIWMPFLVCWQFSGKTFDQIVHLTPHLCFGLALTCNCNEPSWLLMLGDFLWCGVMPFTFSVSGMTWNVLIASIPFFHLVLYIMWSIKVLCILTVVRHSCLSTSSLSSWIVFVAQTFRSNNVLFFRLFFILKFTCFACKRRLARKFSIFLESYWAYFSKQNGAIPKFIWDSDYFLMTWFRFFSSFLNFHELKRRGLLQATVIIGGDPLFPVVCYTQRNTAQNAFGKKSERFNDILGCCPSDRIDF